MGSRQGAVGCLLAAFLSTPLRTLSTVYRHVHPHPHRQLPPPVSASHRPATAPAASARWPHPPRRRRSTRRAATRCPRWQPSATLQGKKKAGRGQTCGWVGGWQARGRGGVRWGGETARERDTGTQAGRQHAAVWAAGELTGHRQLSEGKQVGGLWLRRQHLSVCQGALRQHCNLLAAHNRLLQEGEGGKGWRRRAGRFEQ